MPECVKCTPVEVRQKQTVCSEHEKAVSESALASGFRDSRNEEQEKREREGGWINGREKGIGTRRIKSERTLTRRAKRVIPSSSSEND